MKVFAIAGCKRSGKDTAAAILKNLWESHDSQTEAAIRVGQFAFADALRDVCKIVFGYTDEHFLDPLFKESMTSPILGDAWTPRRALQFVGTDLFRQQVDPDVWVHVGIERLRAMEHDFDVVLVTDCRFENEVRALKTHFENVTTLFVIRPGHMSSRPEHPHESERFVQETEKDMLPKFDAENRIVGFHSGIFDFAIVNFEDELEMFVDCLQALHVF
jgi:hypothetical protein